MIKLKNDVISDMKELKNLGVCNQRVIDAVANGEFDEDIKESENMKVSELTDMIISLFNMR